MDVRVFRVHQLRKVTVPIPLILSDVGTYTGYNCLIVVLCLPFCWRMIGSRENSFNAEEAAQRAGELCNEQLAAVS